MISSVHENASIIIYYLSFEVFVCCESSNKITCLDRGTEVIIQPRILKEKALAVTGLVEGNNGSWRNDRIIIYYYKDG